MSRGLPQDTIAAISTPWGEGGIGIVRLSGPRALEVARRVFRRRNEHGPLHSHRFYLGEIIHPQKGALIDEGFLVFMAPPRTYTREDVVEIQCHSGPLILREVLEALLACGARLAEPGEFTKRAFLNGRLDLTRAEAVIDLIRSKTDRSLAMAHALRTGKLAAAVTGLREELLNLVVFIEAGLDFPEEEVPELAPPEVRLRILQAGKELKKLLKTYEEGKIYREGIAAAIVGRPNVGKSSLLNGLLAEARAIVTPIPGTTRDVIEEQARIGDLAVRLMDTAGLRAPGDQIEEEGVRRTRECLARADLVIWVVDGSEHLSSEDLEIPAQLESRKAVVAVNKNDLPQRVCSRELEGRVPGAPLVSISALKGTGLGSLKEAIRKKALNGVADSAADLLLANVRHKEAVEAAGEALARSLATLDAGLSYEFLIPDLKEGLRALGEISGETATEEVLERIFSQFCIGK